MIDRNGLYRSVALPALALVLVGASVAESHATVLEEIMVTAQRRSQDLRDVPIAVSAYSADEMRKLQIQQPMDLSIQTLGLLTKQSFNGATSVELFLRGVGLSDFSATSLPAVGVYVDEVVRPSPAMLGFPLHDMERIEVLKGPQGTLYGRNSPAGAVNFVTRKPTEEFDAYVRGSVSRWSTAEIEGAVGGGLAEGLAGRVSVFQRSSSSDGYYTNRFDNNNEVGEISLSSIRGQLQWEPSTDLTVNLAVHWFREDSDTGIPEIVSARDPLNPAVLCDPIKQGVRSEGACVNPLGYFDADADPYVGSSSAPGLNETDSTTASLTINWDLDAVTLTSISSFQDFKRDQRYDVDGSPFLIGDVYTGDDINVYTQELRLTSNNEGRLDWILGAFYSKDEIDFIQHIFLDDLLGFTTTNGGRQDTESMAGFAHVEYEITEMFALSGGIRYTHEKKKWVGGSYLGFFETMTEAEQSGLQFAGIPIQPGGNLSGALPGGPLDFPSTLKENEIDGRITLEVRPAEDVLLYAGFSKGFKSGGYPSAVLFDQRQQEPFGAEKLYAYEAGFKATVLEGSMQITGAAFYYDYQDWQANFTVSGELNSRLQNAGDVEIKGLEGEVNWMPIEGLTLRSGVIWMTNKIKNSAVLQENLLTGAFESINGNRIPNAPKFSANGLVRYEMPVANSLMAGLQMDYKYVGGHYLEVNNREFLHEDGYLLLNARVSLFSDSDSWELALAMRNLTNRTFYTAGFDLVSPGSLGAAVRFPSQPRSWTVEFIHRW